MLGDMIAPGRTFENPEAEQALLGGLLTSNPSYDRVADLVRPEHFSDEVHGEFYRIIAARITAGRVADPVTVRDEAEANPITGPHWKKYLANMTNAMVGISSMRDYAVAVHEAWAARQIRVLGQELVSEVRDGALTPTKILEDAQGRIHAIAQSGDGSRPVTSASSAVDTLLAATESNWRNGNALSGLSTGYAELDERISGVRRGGMYVIAARPGMGKSALGLGLAVRMARQHGRVLFWSGEMSADELMGRALAAKCRMPFDAVISGHWSFPDGGTAKFKQPDLDRLTAAGMKARQIPLVIDDREAASVAQIATRARRMSREKAGLSAIVLDYIGLMRGSSEVRRSGSRTAEVTEISADIARMARELNVPVIALSQLNRQSENREDRRPTLSDIRDSGAIEQDARCVIAIYREEAAIATRMSNGMLLRHSGESDAAFSKREDETMRRLDEVRGRGELIILKNRGGRTGVIPMLFDGPSTWFRDKREGERSEAW